MIISAQAASQTTKELRQSLEKPQVAQSHFDVQNPEPETTNATATRSGLRMPRGRWTDALHGIHGT